MVSPGVKHDPYSGKQLPSPADKAKLPSPPLRGEQREQSEKHLGSFLLYLCHQGSPGSKARPGTMLLESLPSKDAAVSRGDLPSLLLRRHSQNRM